MKLKVRGNAKSVDLDNNIVEYYRVLLHDCQDIKILRLYTIEGVE